MTIFEDILSDELALDELLEGEGIPSFRFRNKVLKPQKVKVDMVFTENEIKEVFLEVFLNRVEDVLILAPLFRICGYKDMRQLSSLFKHPESEVSVVFKTNDLFDQYISELLPIKSAAHFFNFETPFGQQPFHYLDQAYTFVNAQVKRR